jgi:CubicO group peptidase (beta-lactamase class C family)
MRILLVPAILLTTVWAAPPIPNSRPSEVGVSSERLARADAAVQRYIDKGEIAGAVIAVARHGKLVELKSLGLADLQSRKPMQTDAIFRLASMTKPITSIAVMMLHEEGRFLIDDPISKFLPEFKDAKVAVANKPNERQADGFHLVPAEPITIRHLLAHTAGLSSGTAGPTMEIHKKMQAARKPDEKLEDYIKALAALPLNFQPGTAWEYGPATDVLGRLVEVVSGKTLDEYFREQIFAPLGMTDTFFYVPSAKLPRLVTAYAKGEDGKLAKLPASKHELPGHYYSGAGGLAGSTEDYLRFTQMLLNGGQWNGKRLVSRKTIELMTANHIGNIPLWRENLGGYRFGLGFRVLTDMGKSPTLGSVGSYGWSGAYGTYFWVDPKEDMVGILMIQLLPNAHLNIRYAFQNAVTQALVD